MACIDLINAICINVRNIHTSRWYEFFKRLKLKYFNKKLIKEIDEYDIFDTSNAVCTFLSALPPMAISKAGIEYREAFLRFSVGNNTIDYNPLGFVFTVEDADHSYIYTVKSGQSIISNKVNSVWNPLIKEIKQFYSTKILELAKIVSEWGDEFE